MRNAIMVAAIAAGLLLGGAAGAAEAETAAESPNVLGLGVKGGVGLPQIGSELDTSFQVKLEAFYLLPVLGSRLGLVTSAGYSQPEAAGSGSDERLPGGSYSWEMTQRQTTWDIGVMGRLQPWSSDWNIGLSAGFELLFLSTLTDGEADGEPFGEHDERATLPGVFAAVTGEYRLGPGALFAELVFSATFQDLTTTGDLTASALAILLGYRVGFAL